MPSGERTTGECVVVMVFSVVLLLYQREMTMLDEKYGSSVSPSWSSSVLLLLSFIRSIHLTIKHLNPTLFANHSIFLVCSTQVQCQWRCFSHWLLIRLSFASWSRANIFPQLKKSRVKRLALDKRWKAGYIGRWCSIQTCPLNILMNKTDDAFSRDRFNGHMGERNLFYGSR